MAKMFQIQTPVHWPIITYMLRIRTLLMHPVNIGRSTTIQNVQKWYFKVAQFWGAHRLPVVRKYDRLFYSYVDVRTVTDFI